MGAYLLRASNNTVISFDVVLSEHFDLAVVITEHPVEKGSDITDNIKPQLAGVMLEVFVSNQPSGPPDERRDFPPGADPAVSFESVIEFKELKSNYGPLVYEPPLSPTPGAIFNAIGGAIKSLIGTKRVIVAEVLTFDHINAVSATIATLDGAQKAGELFTIITGSRVWENMAIEKIGGSRALDDGDGMSFSISFKEVKIVETKIVKAPIPTEDRGKLAVNKGAQGPKKKEGPGKTAAFAVFGPGGFFSHLF